MITINAACATLGTPIFGYIVDRTGSYAIAWQVLGAFLTLGIIGLITLLKDPRDQSGSPIRWLGESGKIRDPSRRHGRLQ